MADRNASCRYIAGCFANIHATACRWASSMVECDECDTCRCNDFTLSYTAGEGIVVVGEGIAEEGIAVGVHIVVVGGLVGSRQCLGGRNPG